MKHQPFRFCTFPSRPLSIILKCWARYSWFQTNLRKKKIMFKNKTKQKCVMFTTSSGFLQNNHFMGLMMKLETWGNINWTLYSYYLLYLQLSCGELISSPNCLKHLFRSIFEDPPGLNLLMWWKQQLTESKLPPGLFYWLSHNCGRVADSSASSSSVCVCVWSTLNANTRLTWWKLDT